MQTAHLSEAARTVFGRLLWARPLSSRQSTMILEGSLVGWLPCLLVSNWSGLPVPRLQDDQVLAPRRVGQSFGHLRVIGLSVDREHPVPSLKPEISPGWVVGTWGNQHHPAQARSDFEPKWPWVKIPYPQ